MYEKDYTAAKAHNQAKLALVLFTYELTRLLEGTGVTANCLHPGAVATSYTEKDPDASPFLLFFQKLFKPFFMNPEKGAETTIYLASSPEVDGVTGKYFEKKKAVESSPESYDDAISKQLWDVSAELANLNWSKAYDLDVDLSYCGFAKKGIKMRKFFFLCLFLSG